MTEREVIGVSRSSMPDRVVRSVMSAVRHPVATAGFAAGLAKGAAEATVSLARRTMAEVRPGGPGSRGSAEERAEVGRVGERSRFGGLNTEAAPPRMPGGGGEQFENEPTAESRAADHGTVPASSREADGWIDELDSGSEESIPTSAGTSAADVGRNPDTDESDLRQPGTEPLVDPATAKAVRSEAETLGRAADPDKDRGRE